MAIQTFGGIAKEEHLINVEHDVIPNTFVLQNLEAFPGYHGANLPSDKMPDSIFLMTTKKISTERIFRLSHNVQNYLQTSFEASPGKICIYNDTYNCIRLREFESMQIIPQIQSCFMDSEVKFMKKKQIDANGIIQLKKIFNIERIDEKMYKDVGREMYYLEINRQLTWGHFKKITQNVKNNLDPANFDAALAAIYASQLLDLIRVYSKELNLDDLKSIHKKFLEVISKERV